MRVFLFSCLLINFSLNAAFPESEADSGVLHSIARNVRGTILDPVFCTIETLRSWEPSYQKRRDVYNILVNHQDLTESELETLYVFYTEGCPNIDTMIGRMMDDQRIALHVRQYFYDAFYKVAPKEKEDARPHKRDGGEVRHSAKRSRHHTKGTSQSR